VPKPSWQAITRRFRGSGARLSDARRVFAYNIFSYTAPVMRWGVKPSRSIFQDLPDFHQRAGDCLNRFCGLFAAAGSA